MMEAAGQYRISINFYQAKWHHKPQYSNLHSHSCDNILCCKLVVAHTLIMIIRKQHIKLVDSCDIINFCNSTINQYDQLIHFNRHYRFHNNLKFQWHLAHLLYLISTTNNYKTVSSTFLC